SGSLVLLTVGLYEPTLRAVEALDLGYIAVFGAGLALGAVVIVQLLKWLLDHHHSTTLLVLSGVMLGALRALWPYQTEDGALHPIGDTLSLDILLATIRAVVVLILIWAAREMRRHAPQPAFAALGRRAHRRRWTCCPGAQTPHSVLYFSRRETGTRRRRRHRCGS